MASTLRLIKMPDAPKRVRFERATARAEQVQATMDRGVIARATEWRAQPRPQQQINSKKAASLAMLAAAMVGSEEAQKKNLAVKLQEDLAQTLTAIRLGIEQGMERTGAGDDIRRDLLWTVPALQSAIKQVQALAMQLHPCGLDDFGLLPAVRLFCREFERQHPAIRIEDRICLQPNYAFGPLAIIIYRVIESAFVSIAQFVDAQWISLSLLLNEHTIVLTIDVVPRAESHAGSAHMGNELDPNSCFASARGRTVLSGGAFSATRTKARGITLHAHWAL